MSLRWLDELRDPAKKCARLGHKMRRWTVRVYLYPPEYRWSHVADTGEEAHARCRRCGHVEPVVTTRLGGLNGLSMSSEKWDRLRKDGRVA